MVLDTKPLACPICLAPPVCPKVTKCGHVYCWPCILHYLSFSDKAWRKCPICYDAVYAKDVKSVQVNVVESTGSPCVAAPVTLNLTLMKRMGVCFYLNFIGGFHR